MSRVSFRQADIERILRATKAVGASVQIDLRTLVVTAHPPGEASIVVDPLKGFQPDGKEDWSDIDEHAAKKKPPFWDFDL